MKAAFLIIATNKYTEFLEPLCNSIIKNVKLPDCHIDTICFTNKATSPRVIPTTRAFHIDHLPWPLITLMRYHTFVKYSDILQEYDYLHYIDADNIIVDEISNEIIGDFTVTQHPGFFDKPPQYWPLEYRQESRACFKNGDSYPQNYFIGAGFGGRTPIFLEACKTMEKWVAEDLYKNIIPIWHDESILNRWLYEFKPNLNILNPGYCYPEGWKIPFTPKIMAKSKNQKDIRF